MICPIDGCEYESNELGVKIHKGKSHGKNFETCANCGEEFHRPPAKTRESNKPFCSRECMSEYRTGENNPNGTNSVEVTCANCGESIKKMVSEANRGQENYYCNNKCNTEHWRREKIQSGEENPMFGGGSHWRTKAKWKNTRNSVVKDSCKVCDSGENLHVHHIVPVYAEGEKYDEKNLMTICENCHFKIHSHIDDYFNRNNNGEKN